MCQMIKCQKDVGGPKWRIEEVTGTPWRRSAAKGVHSVLGVQANCIEMILVNLSLLFLLLVWEKLV